MCCSLEKGMGSTDNATNTTTQMSSQQVVMRSSEDATSGMKIEQNVSSGKWECGKAVMTHIW